MPGDKITKIKDGLYFPSLTGVRAIAAYMVFFHHYNFFKNGGMVHNFSAELHTGVTLFFVLSGFLIAFRYLYNDEFNFKNYLVNRIARIYPMYFLLTTLTFLFYAIFRGSHGIKYFLVYLSNITFIRGYFDNFKFTGIEQGWSLTVEETFYFMAPVIFIFVRKRIIYLLILPVILMLSGFIIVYLFKGLKNEYGFFGSNDFMLIYTFFGRCFEFFIGIGLAIFFRNNSEQRNAWYATYLGIVVIIACIFWMSALGTGSISGITHPMGKVINNVVLPFFGITPFFYGLLTEKTWVSKVLGSRIFILLGKSSYIFYLIHIGVIANLLHSLHLNILLLFVFLNIIALILFKFIEEPLNGMIRKKFAGSHIPAIA